MNNSVLPEDPEYLKFRYKGPSMRPTFKPGQVLYICPEGRAFRPGDVVVYKSGAVNVVHRVCAVTAEGVMTRGDNNLSVDAQLIPFEEILGVVERAEDWDATRGVTGGRWGLWRARARWRWKTLWLRSLPWLGAPYRWLKARRWVGRLWRPRVTMVRVNSSGSEIVKYVVDGNTVATFEPASGRFTYRRPYDLVIFPPERTN